MPDRVKQTIFDMLGSRFDTPGALPPLLVADVFAGSGSMGLEALSRGAAFCTFFEHDRDALEALRGNVESLGAGSESRVVAEDAWRASMATPDGRPFALIFLDPPYRGCEDTTASGDVRRFLQQITRSAGDSPLTLPSPPRGERGPSKPSMSPVDERLVVLHHPVGTRFALSEDDLWRVVEERRIGSNAVTFFAS